MYRLVLLTVFGLLCIGAKGQQKTISITIDDVPNTQKYRDDGFRSIFLDRLDSLDVPFTVFFNESKVFQNESIKKNIELLERWIAHQNSNLGNHSFSHLRYSEVGYARFIDDIQKGEKLSDSLAILHKKSIDSFRFPFNDLGKDSLQHVHIKAYLSDRGDEIAPFTIESSDWMYDAVYRYYLEIGEHDKAKKIGQLYVIKTMELLGFFERMAVEIYGRPISHIYLCHDNSINADYIHHLVSALRIDGYQIVSYDESLLDQVYRQEDNYFQKWGVSWLFRWMATQNERVHWMKQEPDLTEIQQLFDQLQQNR